MDTNRPLTKNYTSHGGFMPRQCLYTFLGLFVALKLMVEVKAVCGDCIL